MAERRPNIQTDPLPRRDETSETGPKSGLIPVFPAPRKVMHYSNRGTGATDIVVRGAIVRDISTGLVDKSGKDDRPY